MSEGKRFDELDKKIASARRLKKAIECRSSFVDFVKYTMPDADDPENIDYKHPLIKQVLEPTHGAIIFQEQVMELCNFSIIMQLKEDIISNYILMKK